MLFLYRCAWALLLPVLRLFPLWPRAWSVSERLRTESSVGPDGDALWLHGASLGEARALWALAQRLDWEGPVLITATTTAGRDWLENRRREAREISGSRSLHVRLAPVDHSGVLRPFLAANRIRAAVFYEMELWPHALEELRRARCSVIWASARLTPRAARIYGFFPAGFREVAGRFTAVQPRSQADARRLRALGAATAGVGCDFKAAFYLGPDPGNPEKAPSRPISSRPGIAFLSLHARELRFFMNLLPVLGKKGPLFVFPRRPEEFERFRMALGPLGFAVFSRGETGPHMLVDDFGHTGRFLPLCHSAFLGGTWIPVGGHNLWEPLQYGLKTYLGPYRFQQEPLAAALLACGLAESVLDPGRFREEAPPAADHPDRCRSFLEAEKVKIELALEELRRDLKIIPDESGHRKRVPNEKVSSSV
jgi:3-deoxy-D-manno-octulosonic-acid transferase